MIEILDDVRLLEGRSLEYSYLDVKLSRPSPMPDQGAGPAYVYCMNVLSDLFWRGFEAINLASKPRVKLRVKRANNVLYSRGAGREFKAM